MKQVMFLLLMSHFIFTWSTIMSQQFNEIEDLSPFLQNQVEETSLPALGAIILDSENILAQGVAGVRKLGDETPAGLNDRWHIGSCTKAMTSTLIARLVEKGKLKWDMKITDAIPELGEIMLPVYKDVTLEMLLTNRAGLGNEWKIEELWNELWQRKGSDVDERRKLAEYMLSHPPEVEPGKYFYSNSNFAIAAHMAEVIVGSSWEVMIKELLFDPLNMSSAGLGVPWTDLPPTDPFPHNAERNPITPGKFADNPPSIGPAGVVHCTLQDWAKFVREHLRAAEGKETKILNPEIFKELHKGYPTGEEGDYAMGWLFVERFWAKGDHPGDRGRCFTHAGSNNMWFALCWVAPEIDRAFMVVTNITEADTFQKVDGVIWKVIKNHLKL